MGSHLFDDVVDLWQIGSVEWDQPLLRLLAFAVIGIDRIVPELRVLAREYEHFLMNAQLSVMSDPESLRLMRATHVAHNRPPEGRGNRKGPILSHPVILIMPPMALDGF